MKRLKRYLCSFLAMSMLIGCIDIGFATDEKVSKNMESSSGEELNSENRIKDEGNSLSQNIENETSKMKTESSLETKTMENQSTILEEDSENETDNWELGLVFYDSTVDNGTTPLTEINWDASDGGYGEGKSRVITVQINYRNTNCVRDYVPGELEINIPNLVYNTYLNEDDSPFWDSSIIVGANDSTHTGYDWNFVTGNEPTNKQETYKFRNANTIEEKSNFEGSLQIAYVIMPSAENPEKYEDNCIHSFNKIILATLNNMKSNDITFNYKRIYNHSWKKRKYPLTKSATKIMSYDNLPSNASDYIWVKYKFYISRYNDESDYPYMGLLEASLKDSLPDGCVVFDM